MKIGSKEFYDMQNEFEKQLLNYPGLYVSAKIERVKPDENGKLPPGEEFYTNGEVSKLFTAYMLGYAYRDYLTR